MSICIKNLGGVARAELNLVTWEVIRNFACFFHFLSIHSLTSKARKQGHAGTGRILPYSQIDFVCWFHFQTDFIFYVWPSS